jgi:hypothetical protein
MTTPEQCLERFGAHAGLTPEERKGVLAQLHAHIAAAPPRSGIWARVSRHARLAGGQALAYGMAAVLLLAGGTGALAHRALPGNWLYPVKLAVNDRIALVFTWDEAEKLEKELAQMSRMFDEEERAAEIALAEDEKDARAIRELEEEEAEDRPVRENDDEQERDERKNRNNTAADDAEYRELEQELRALERDLEKAAEDEIPED